MTLTPAIPLVLGVLLAPGCAYYNGLYNADRLADEARRAERVGRPAEARSLWAQAAVKAESVATRHRRSRYRDDALLLQGTALRAVGECAQATHPLRTAVDSGQDPRVRDQARLVLGQCHMLLGQPDSAWQVLDALARAGQPELRPTAVWWRGRAALRLGRPVEALDDLADVRAAEAAFDRAAALAALRRVNEIEIALRPVLPPAPFDEPRWASTLEAVGAAEPDVASRLTDSLVAGGATALTAGQRARLLLADADRWLRRNDEGHTRSRLDMVVSLANDSAEGGVGRVRRTLLELRHATELNEIGPLVSELLDASRDGGLPATLAEPAIAMLEPLGEGATGARPVSDLQLFLLAEQLRDSLEARLLAAAVFRRVQRDYPLSPIAPKALLAAATLDPSATERLLAEMRRSYPDSPYREVLDGEASASYAVLEDSLRTLARNSAVRPPEARNRSPEPRGVGDDEAQRRARRPGASVRPEP